MIPVFAKWPPQISTIEKGLLSIDVAYHLNHRIKTEPLINLKLGILKEGIGHYKYSNTGPGQELWFAITLTRCEFDNGILTAVLNKFKPKDGNNCRVKHNDLLNYKNTVTIPAPIHFLGKIIN